MKQLNYRKLFSQHFGIQNLSNKYAIHHIDRNHNNNDIDNLMILPKQLHGRYHHKIGRLSGIDFTTIINSNALLINHLEIEELFDILQECAKWKDYKEYLNGRLPNIHNITLED